MESTRPARCMELRRSRAWNRAKVAHGIAPKSRMELRQSRAWNCAKVAHEIAPKSRMELRQSRAWNCAKVAHEIAPLLPLGILRGAEPRARLENAGKVV